MASFLMVESFGLWYLLKASLNIGNLSLTGKGKLKAILIMIRKQILSPYVMYLKNLGKCG